MKKYPGPPSAASVIPPPCSRCGARHRTWRRLARCRWPGAAWVTGEGRFASVSLCPPDVTVMLFREREKAEEAKGLIDRLACGGRCWKRHRLVDLAGVRP
jgi:hypothetical protein